MYYVVLKYRTNLKFCNKSAKIYATLYNLNRISKYSIRHIYSLTKIERKFDTVPSVFYISKKTIYYTNVSKIHFSPTKHHKVSTRKKSNTERGIKSSYPRPDA